MLDSLQKKVPGLKDYIKTVYTTIKYEIPEQENRATCQVLKE